MTTYSKANTTEQWFQDDYPGAVMDPNAGVLHTTEGTTWPGYNGGASAPTYTACPNLRRQRLEWRAHFPDERSSRALRNTSGGVETNTLNVVQVELVGTCDPGTARRWRAEGRAFIYWPEAPEWALRDLADFIADMYVRHGIALEAPTFHPYPGSYGVDNPHRFTYAQWRNFHGWCGHQHVPENSHGDPGDLPIGRVLDYAKTVVAPELSRGRAVDKSLALIRRARRRAAAAGKRGRAANLTRAVKRLKRINPH